MLCELEEYVQSHVNWVHTVPCLQFWWTHLIQEINPASVNSQLPIWSIPQATVIACEVWWTNCQLPIAWWVAQPRALGLPVNHKAGPRESWALESGRSSNLFAQLHLSTSTTCVHSKELLGIPCWIHSTWYQPQSQWGHVLLSTENASLIPVL